MNNKLLFLLKKELTIHYRNRDFLLGVAIFNILFTILICSLFRNLGVTPKEVGLIACPYLWIIFVLSMLRVMLQSTQEESTKGLYLIQTKQGYQPSNIFYSKLIGAFIAGMLLVLSEFSAFTLLMGYKDIVNPLISYSYIFIISLPGLTSLSLLSAFISHRSRTQEVLMPVLLLPLILLLSIAVVSLGESIFNDGYLDYSNYWLKVVVGLQILLVLTSELLFRELIKLKLN